MTDTNIQSEGECQECARLEREIVILRNVRDQKIATIARLEQENKELRQALKALMTNPSIDLGDMVYRVRDIEGKGWEGPDVIAWGEAVEKARKLLEP